MAATPQANKQKSSPVVHDLSEVSPTWTPRLKAVFIASIILAVLLIGLRVFIGLQGENSSVVKTFLPGADWFFESNVRKAHWAWPASLPGGLTLGHVFNLLSATAAGAMILTVLGLPPLAKHSTRTRLAVFATGCAILLGVFFLHLSIVFQSEVAPWPAQLGMVWQDEADVKVHWWRWPEITFIQNELFTFSVRASVLVDMLVAALVAVSLAILLGIASLRKWPGKRFVRVSGILAGCLAVLVFTFHWCNIDPLGVWRSRGNAFEHLFGRVFTEEQVAEIRADAERAPEYYAMGEANYIIGEKYKNVPASETPNWRQKQDEMEAIKASLLAEMSPEEKEAIVRKEYNRLLDKKRGGYFPPETAWARLKTYWDALMETVAIAIWASLLAVLCAIPLSILAASNTLAIIAPGDASHHRALRWFGVFVVRRFLDSCRGFNELVMALIFVSVIGLGPFAGILALWIHTTGILGKVFSEAIEAIDPGQVEALLGTGAGSTQAISFSVMPQVMPTVISYSLLRFESNVRSAAILGWVGAGGIGFLLQDKMNGYNYREVCTMMIMIIVAVCVIDYFCGRLRRRFI